MHQADIVNCAYSLPWSAVLTKETCITQSRVWDRRDTDLLIPNVFSVQSHRWLHGKKGQDLKQMILHDITNNSIVVEIPAIGDGIMSNKSPKSTSIGDCQLLTNIMNKASTYIALLLSTSYILDCGSDNRNLQTAGSPYPPRPSVPKSSENMSCTFLIYWRDHKGSNTRLENRSTDKFSTSSLPK